MNKGQRTQIEKRKWHQRLRNYKIPLDKAYSWGIKFKAQGRPCNCSACRKLHYKRSIKHKISLQQEHE